MSFVTPDALLKSPASYTAPIASTGSFLSGILGAANPAAGMLSALGALAGGPDAALQPDVNTVDGRQQLGLQISSAFQVGGAGNSLDASPRLDASPVDSTKTAPAAGGPGGINGNVLVIAGAFLLALLLFALGGSRRRS